MPDDPKESAISALAWKLADLEMSDEVGPYIKIAELLYAALEAKGLKTIWKNGLRRDRFP